MTMSRVLEGNIFCTLCGESGKNLKSHVRREHDLESYRGPLLSPSSRLSYSRSNSGRVPWQSQLKQRGEWTEEASGALGAKISAAIMSSPEERCRRSDLMGELNKRQDFRDRSSRVARETSSRPEIIAQRTEQLRRWRFENPDDFKSKCTDKLRKWNDENPALVALTIQKIVESSRSKAELALCSIISDRLGIADVSPHYIFDDRFSPYNTSKMKQVDVWLPSLGVAVEYDGFLHFMDTSNDYVTSRYEESSAKDRILEEVLFERGVRLVRLSRNAWDRASGSFDESSLDKLFEAIEVGTEMLTLIGEDYKEQSWRK